MLRRGVRRVWLSDMPGGTETRPGREHRPVRGERAQLLGCSRPNHSGYRHPPMTEPMRLRPGRVHGVLGGGPGGPLRSLLAWFGTPTVTPVARTRLYGSCS